MRHGRILPVFLACLFTLNLNAQNATELLPRAEEGLRRAVTFFRERVAAGGGYLWHYSSDLNRGEGEQRASKTTIWVQPPGTPSVGIAYTSLYNKTKDRYYLDAAAECARALVNGQLQSGGWDYRIEFDPEKRKDFAYRSDARTKGRNTTTLDDDTTQAALRCLIQVDRALEFKDAPIHEAAQYGLNALIKAQYPNGAWPQRYQSFPSPDQSPVRKAEFPESWSRTFPGKDYTGYYTLNDNTLIDTISTMFYAAEVYSEKRYRAAAIRGGDFLILAQMPDPQPAWAQQYDAQMHPAWARKFEPPAITGRESQDVLVTLLDLYARTQDSRYLDSVGRALDYLKKCRLRDGRLARFYELETNKPLYFTKTYELTYSGEDTPTHYAFVVSNRLNEIEAAYRRAQKSDMRQPAQPRPEMPAKMTPELAKQAQDVLNALDERGAWVEPGKLQYYGDDDPAHEVIRTDTFIRNIGILGSFIESARTVHE